LQRIIKQIKGVGKKKEERTRDQLERDIYRLLSIINDLNGIQKELILVSNLLDVDLECRFQSLREGLTEKRKELEYKLENDPKSVSIYDVIKECEGVTDREELIKILKEYEINLIDDWVSLEKRAWYLDQPMDCIFRGYQLRLKDCK